jgi:hypothetical protein
MRDLERRVAKLEEIARNRGGLDPSWPLVVILRPGDPDPEIPEGCRPLVIDCRNGGPEPARGTIRGVIVDPQDLRL